MRQTRFKGEAETRAAERQAQAVERAEQAEVQEPVWAYRLTWASVLLLLAFGLLMVFSASSVVGLFRENEDGFYFLRQQAITAAAGLILLFGISRLDYRRLRPLSFLGLGFAALLLILVRVPGVGSEAGGATRWLELGFISLQPSEFAKLAVVVFGAHVLSSRRILRGDQGAMFLRLVPPVGALCLLILLQPDLGTTVMVGMILLGLLWVAGMGRVQWFGLSGTAFAFAALMIATADYRRQRFLAFLDPFADAQDSGFQIVQALIAIGSGGLFGVGPGQSVQKFSYLPEAHTDMIFAIVGEEFGLLGITAVIALFAALLLSAWRIARGCADPFGKYLVAGTVFLIGGQALLNMGGVMAALPLTGVPLPFISFGRTNLLVVLAAVGIILSVARHCPLEAASGPASASSNQPKETLDNVTYLDRRRRNGGTRRPRPSHS